MLLKFNLKMNDYKKILFLSSLILLFGLASNVSAHLPRIVDGNTVNINDAEVSQAFYGELKGESATYIINSNSDFTLYANILVPKSTNANGRYSLDIFKIVNGKEELLIFIDSASVVWTEFYEEFAGDYYLKGPEFEKTVEAGEYKIFVYGNNNSGKYVLATGKQEVFTLPETIKDIWILPKLKINFFHTSVFVLLTTPLKWIFIIPAFILSAIAVLAVFLSKRMLKKRKKETVPKERDVGRPTDLEA